MLTIGHQVIWLGRLIGWLDQALNRESHGDVSRRIAGFFATFCIVVVPAAVAFVVERYVLSWPFGFLAVGLVASSLLAQRSL
ncbi:MAG: adenosylcobinamide-phosphate synthase, partial [Hyphomicrobiales bacterium]